jgi:NitT/TauT family transport system ATP-binding protein
MNFEVLRIWGEVKNTIVLITHDVTEAVLLSDRVFVMTRRPSRIGTLIDIDLPRPRDRTMLDSPELHGYTRTIRDVLYGHGESIPASDDGIAV